MMADDLIGFELLYQCAKPDIKKKEDLLALLVHHCLLKNGFKCAGNGQEWDNNEAVSEVLPNGWNTSNEYTLRYKRDENKFILMSNRTDDVIVFNFTSPDQMKVSNVIFNIEESVKGTDGNISSMLPTHQNVMRKIKEELVTPFALTKTSNADTQTTAEKPSKVRIMSESTPFCNRDMRTEIDFHDLNNIGRRDLDPLAAMGGGGMLFDPLREHRRNLQNQIGMPERLPRGAVPPSARFDPFGPPDNSITGRRFPDYDDMFS